jgi:hypothetical protein
MGAKKIKDAYILIIGNFVIQTKRIMHIAALFTNYTILTSFDVGQSRRHLVTLWQFLHLQQSRSLNTACCRDAILGNG